MSEARRYYAINNLDINDINYIFNQLSDRLDQLEGYRGTPTFKSDVDFGGNKGVNAGNASSSTDFATLGNVDIETGAIIDPIINLIYPIGALLITTKSDDPSTYLGGTWAAFGTGKTIIGIDLADTDFDTVEDTGGTKTHDHTVDINSTTSGLPSATTTVDNDEVGSTVAVASGTHTHDTDPLQIDSSAESNIPPYIVVYMWKRTV